MIRYGTQEITESDIEAVIDVLKSDFLTQGPVTNEFERQLAEYCGAKYSCSFSNATAALHASCLALGLTEGDWLWTSSNSFVASANCGVYCGAKIDFVDIDLKTHNICLNALKLKLELAKVQGRLPKILVVVHFAGLSCDMYEIWSLSKKYHFRVIEDASHAVGARYKGKKVGCCAYSDITVFSFHPVKIITTGEGGMLTTNDPELISRARLFQSHGITKMHNEFKNSAHGPWYYEQQVLGYNYRMTDIQSALGISQLSRLDEYINHRNQLADLYDSHLRDTPLSIPVRKRDRVSSCHLYVVKVPHKKEKLRRQLIEALLDQKIGAHVHYIPIHSQPFFRDMPFEYKNLSQTEQYYERAITLPLHVKLLPDDVSFITDTLKSLWAQMA